MEHLELRPRREFPLEWWFVHGRVHGPEFPARRFMASLFRQDMGIKRGRHAHTLIWSWLNEKTMAHRAGCTVEMAAVDLLISAPPRLLRCAPDRDLFRAYLEMVKRQGPPHPVRVAPTCPLWSGADLAVIWEGFALNQNQDRLLLTLPQHNGESDVHLKAHVGSPPLDFTPAQGAQGPVGRMGYVCHPRLKLVGHSGEQTLGGELWMDHQWGDYHWLVSRETHANPKPLGWVWFGITLDSGHDLMIMTHWDAASGETLAAHAVLARQGVIEKEAREVLARPLGTWRSPRTWIEYPVHWELQVPALGFQTVARPLVHDQEIPLFGPARAIWQGVTRIHGSLMGRQVRGQGRCELYGHGLSQGMDALTALFGEKIDGHIRAFLPRQMNGNARNGTIGQLKWEYGDQDYEAVLAEPAWELMSRKGKKWRPLFGLLLLEALGTPCGQYEDLIILLGELPHNGSLTIDDIQDNSSIRRGGPCLHHMYGLGPSINFGNLLYFLPFELLARHRAISDSQRLEAFQIATAQFISAHMGQGMDLRLSQNLTAESLHPDRLERLERTLLTLYRHKTGSLLAGMAEMVCIIAQSPPHIRAACARFAGGLGILFQVSDDVLNYAKCPRGSVEDIGEGKITYVLIQALRALGPKKARELAVIVADKHLRTQNEGNRRAMELVMDSGALETSRRWCRRSFASRWSRLEPILPPSLPKVLIRCLCEKLIHREQ